MSHPHHHHASEIPLVIVGTYVAGYLAGRWIAVLWTHGPATDHGVRRLVGGAADLAHTRRAA